MRIGVQTGGIEERFGFDQTIAMIHEAGFDAIDMNLDHLLSYADIKNHVNSGFFDLSDAEMKAKLAPWKASIEKHGIDVYQAHSPFPCYIGDAATDAYTLHALKKTIMLCGYFGCKNLIVHPAFKPYDEKLDPEEEWRINKEMYMALLPELRQYGVTANSTPSPAKNCSDSVSTSAMPRWWATTLWTSCAFWETAFVRSTFTTMTAAATNI